MGDPSEVDVDEQIRLELEALGAYDPNEDEDSDEDFDITALDLNAFALPADEDDDDPAPGPSGIDDLSSPPDGDAAGARPEAGESDPSNTEESAVSVLMAAMKQRADRVDILGRELEETVALAAHVDIAEVQALAPDVDRATVSDLQEARQKALTDLDEERQRKEEEQQALREQRRQAELDAIAEREKAAAEAEAERIRLQEEHEAEAKRIEEEQQRAMRELQEKAREQEEERQREARRKAEAEEAERRRLEELQEKERAEAAALEEERRKAAEERAARMEELNARLEQERKLKMEADRLAAIEKAKAETAEKARVEAERLQVEQERQRKEQEERLAEEKRRREEEAKRKAEEDEAQRREREAAEAKRLAEIAERQRAAEEAAKKKKEEEEEAQRVALELAQKKQQEAEEAVRREEERKRGEEKREREAAEMQKAKEEEARRFETAMSKRPLVVAPRTAELSEVLSSTVSLAVTKKSPTETSVWLDRLNKWKNAVVNQPPPSQDESRPAPTPAAVAFTGTETCLDEDMLTSLTPFQSVATVTNVNLGLENIERMTGLHHVPELSTLQLNNNRLRVVEDLDKVPKLKSLFVQDNQLTSLAGIEPAVNLEVLNADSNDLQSMSHLQPLRTLAFLSLQCNQLQSIEGLQQCAQLEALYLYRNSITRMTGLARLEALRYLDLGRNNLTRIEGLEHCPNLEVLVLYENQISEVPDLLTNSLLRSLYLNGNRITSLSNFPWLPRLEQLSIQQNELRDLGSVHSACPLLNSLDVSFNQIESLEDVHRLASLQHLSRVSLNDNPVAEHPEYMDSLAIGHSIRDIDGHEIDARRQEVARKSRCLTKYRVMHLKSLPALSCGAAARRLAGGHALPVVHVPQRLRNAWTVLDTDQGQQETWKKAAMNLMLGKQQSELRQERAKRVSRLGILRDLGYENIAQRTRELEMSRRHRQEHIDFSSEKYQWQFTPCAEYAKKLQQVSRDKAVITVQRVTRGFLARREVTKTRKQASSATRIQAAFRGSRARQLASQMRSARDTRRSGACVKIQALWRGHRTRRMLGQARAQAVYSDDDDFEYCEVDVNMYDDVDIEAIGRPEGGFDLALMTEALTTQMQGPPNRTVLPSNAQVATRAKDLTVDIPGGDSYSALLSPGRESLASGKTPLPLPQAWSSGPSSVESEVRHDPYSPVSGRSSVAASQLGAAYSPSAASVASSNLDPVHVQRVNDDLMEKQQKKKEKVAKKQDELAEAWGFENKETAEMMMKRRQRLLRLRTKKKKAKSLADPQKRLELFQQRKVVNPPPAGLRRTNTNARPSPSNTARRTRPISRTSTRSDAWEVESIASTVTGQSPLPSIRESQRPPVHGRGGAASSRSNGPPSERIPITTSNFTLPPVGVPRGQRTLSAGALDGAPSNTVRQQQRGPKFARSR